MNIQLKNKKCFIIVNRRVLCLFLIFMWIVSVAGCEKKVEQEDLSKQIEEFENSIEKSEKLDTSKYKGIVVGSINMGMNGEWFSEVMNGIKNAGNDLGVTLKMLDSESDLDKEEANIDKLLSEDIDVLVISPIDYNRSIYALQKVKDAGIPIITWNTNVDMEVTAEVCVDSLALGGDTGDYIAEYIKTNNLEDVKLFILTNSSYEVGIERCNGFKASINDLISEGSVKLVADVDAELREDSAKVAKKVLSEHPEINMIWAWNQSSLFGAIDTLKELKNSDIVVMGTDMSMDLANDMLNDKVNLQAITTQLPYNMGYKAIVNGVKAAKGEEIEKKVVIPVDTIVKSEIDIVERYIETHKNLVNE